MDFKTFKECIDSIIDVHKKEIELGRIFDSYIVNFSDNLIGCTIKLLEERMNDDYQWIDYWLWELDFGDTWEKYKIIDKNGEDIKLQTIEDLYNLLIKEKNNES